jgi:uncharacterized membrane protein YfcA
MLPRSSFRTSLDRLAALAGLGIVAGEIYALGYPPGHVLLLAFGALLIYVGTWRVAGRLLHRRANTVLRAEIEQFIALVRKFYSARTRGDAAALHATKTALRSSFERILSAAGTYQEETTAAERKQLAKVLAE